MIPGGAPVLGAPVLGLLDVGSITGGIEQVGRPAVQAGSGLLRFEGVGTQAGQAHQQTVVGTLRFSGVAAHGSQLAAQAALGIERFAGSGAQATTAGAQSAAGLTNIYFGDIAQSGMPQVQSAAGLMWFVADGVVQLTMPSAQLAFGTHGDALAGGIVQSSVEVSTQILGGTLTFFGGGDQQAVAVRTDAAGLMTLIGTVVQTGIASSQALEALLTFAATASQTVQPATQSAAGGWQYLGLAAQTLTPVRQMLFGSESFILGVIAQSGLSSQQAMFGDGIVTGTINSLPSVSFSEALGEVVPIAQGIIVNASGQIISEAIGELAFDGVIVQLSPSAMQLVMALLPQLVQIERIDAVIEFEPALTSTIGIRSN